MREMHKWKDKVELSLDNRQIFFLFFGLSVIGCFVFALGIMTGRRLQWEPGQEAAATGNANSLALLDETDEADERFAFRQGLSQSDAEALPPTRDPELPPRDEDEVRAERAAAEQAAAVEQVEQHEAQVAEVEAQIAEQQKTLAQVAPQAATPEPAAESSAEGRRFTLQMKAFSRAEDANKLADKLRHNGHEVRVESHESAAAPGRREGSSDGPLGPQRPYQIAFERTLKEAKPFETVHRNDPNLRTGAQVVVQRGMRGFKLERVRKFYRGGAVEREEVWELEYPPTREIIRIGTNPAGELPEKKPVAALRDPAASMRIMQ